VTGAAASVALREATVADAAAIAAVHVRAWRETYAGLLPTTWLAAMSPEAHRRRWAREIAPPRAGGAVVVATVGEAVVGFGSCGPQRDDGRLRDAEIYTLYLLRAAQGRGLGFALTAAMARALLAWGAASLDVWALEGNRRAEAFYRRLGGRPEARRPARIGGRTVVERAWVWDDLSAAPFAPETGR
jgi:ribosomal protein S18 acetylase RimI-like enzyme